MIAGLAGPRVVIEGQPAANVDQRVLLGAHRHAVRVRKHLPDDLLDRTVAVPVLALFDEVGVFREATGVEDERHAVCVTQGLRAADVGHRDRLSAAGVVGHREHDHRHSVSFRVQQRLQPIEINVAFERVLRVRNVPCLNDQVDRLGARRLDVGAGGVEVRVAGNFGVGARHDAHQNALGGPTLVSRDHVLERHQVLHRLLEPEVGGRPRVTLVALHQAGPLRRTHRGGARVGQQVDDDVVGVQVEEVVVRVPNHSLPLGPRGELNGLDRLDAERLDDCVHLHGELRNSGVETDS